MTDEDDYTELSDAELAEDWATVTEVLVNRGLEALGGAFDQLKHDTLVSLADALDDALEEAEEGADTDESDPGEDVA